MIVVPPFAVSDASLTSSTVSEPNAPSDYSAVTTYASGAFVTDATTKIVYLSLQSGNTGNTPASSPLYWTAVGKKEVAYNAATTYAISTTAAPIYVYYNHRIYESLQASNTGNNPYSSPAWWDDVGPSLRYGMFDTLRNTATVGASPLVVVIAPGTRVDTLAVLGVSADTVRVQMTSSGTSVYDSTASLVTRDAFNWYDWLFKPFMQTNANLFQDMPPYSNGVITATFTKTSGTVYCGALCVGTKQELGTTQRNPVNDALNFSTVERDSYGNSVLIQRRTVPKTTQTTWADSSIINDIIAARSVLNAVPAVWAGLTDSTEDYFPSLLILGIYKQFSIALMSATNAVITLELEEV